MQGKRTALLPEVSKAVDYIGCKAPTILCIACAWKIIMYQGARIEKELVRRSTLGEVGRQRLNRPVIGENGSLTPLEDGFSSQVSILASQD